MNSPSPCPGLVDMLIALGREIDTDLANNNRARALAVAELTHAIMNSQGQGATEDQLHSLMRFGEQFFRWEFYEEGCAFYTGVYTVIGRLGGGESEICMRAFALATSFDYLLGGMDQNPELVPTIYRTCVTHFGADHPLSTHVRQRMTQKGHLAEAPASGTLDHCRLDMTPKRTPDVACSQESLALWVTLAFFRIAMADGNADEREYLVWKKAMAAMNLPDVWEKHGAPALKDMLHAGKLQTLSAELATLKPERKQALGAVLRDVMLADGAIDNDELSAVAQCVQWLGITMKDIGLTITTA